MAVLEGKVVLVTGAAGGIGRECALRASKEGAKIVVNDFGGSVRGGDNGSPDAAENVAGQGDSATPAARRCGQCVDSWSRIP